MRKGIAGSSHAHGALAGTRKQITGSRYPLATGLLTAWSLRISARTLSGPDWLRQMDHTFSPSIPRRCTVQLPQRTLSRRQPYSHRSRALRCAGRGSCKSAFRSGSHGAVPREGTAAGERLLFAGTRDYELIDEPSVVLTALELSAQHPELTALAVLDRAMSLHADEDLDFQFDSEHELAPPHPFAELIRLAFAPQLDATELCMSSFEWPLAPVDLRMRAARARRRWNRVILRFAERYRIWEPER